MRIGAGRAGTALLISLPGPNDEVELGLEAALGALAGDGEPAEIAGAVATVLRKRLTEKMRRHDGASSGSSGASGDSA